MIGQVFGWLLVAVWLGAHLWIWAKMDAVDRGDA